MRTQIARREKLMPATGIPLTLSLEYATGKRVSSRIPGAPDQMYYSLAGSRETYLPLEVGKLIDDLHLTPGEPFTLCKLGPGNWEVDRQRKDTEPQPHSPADTTKLEHALKTAILAASNAEKYGTEIGYTVRFDSECIKSMAITVLIGMEGR